MTSRVGALALAAIVAAGATASTSRAEPTKAEPAVWAADGWVRSHGGIIGCFQPTDDTLHDEWCFVAHAINDDATRFEITTRYDTRFTQPAQFRTHKPEITTHTVDGSITPSFRNATFEADIPDIGHVHIETGLSGFMGSSTGTYGLFPISYDLEAVESPAGEVIGGMAGPIGSIGGVEIRAHRNFPDLLNIYWIGPTVGVWAMTTATR